MTIRMRAWSLLTVMAFIILYGMYWSTVNVIQVDKVKYFGMMRYEMESDRNLIQHNVYVAIEPWIFAYYFESPYLYIPMEYRDTPRPM